MRLKISYISFIILTFVLIISCTKIETGRIVTCKICGKELSNTVHFETVPLWDKSKYSVTRESGYCDICGNEQVEYTIHIRCARCGNEYDSRTEYASRRLEKHDQTITEGYCSTSCENWARVEGVIDKTSEKVGDIMGRIGKGIYEGIKKHTK